MQLNYQAITLLKHILTTTGETELGQDGKEALAPRRLNGRESSQRRHFVKNTKEITDKVEEKVRELSQKHNDLLKEVREEYKKENPTSTLSDELTDDEKKLAKELATAKEDRAVGSDERVKESIKNFNEETKTLFEEKKEVILTHETTEFVKKYFNEWSDTIGFALGDDSAVEEIENELK